MKIAIIGAGITGLTAAYHLTKNGHQVTIFEKNNQAGGLASGFKHDDWDWHLENYYHHLFTSDNHAINLIEDLDLSDRLYFTEPKSSFFYKNQVSKCDSPLSLLLFPHLSLFEKIRTGIVILSLKITNNWKVFEKVRAVDWLPKYFGRKPYQILWEPLLKSKFGQYSEAISMAWFWARIKKRSLKLGYLEGGFQILVNRLCEEITENGGEIILNTDIDNLERLKKNFDKILVTTPTSTFLKIAPNLPKSYQGNLNKLEMIGAISLILVIREKFLKDDTYWLNIIEKDFPFVAVVEHTNFIDPSHYNNRRILFLGGYYPPNHRYFKMEPMDLLNEFIPFLERINPKYDFKFLLSGKQILSFKLVSNLYAQPIVPINYSQIIPPFETPIPNVYLANMQQIYPFDRGINYSIQLGKQVAQLITS